MKFTQQHSRFSASIAVILLCSNCRWDPITPPHRPYENRRNPYTNGLSIDPRGVADIEPITVGVTNTWEMYSVKGPFNEVEWLILPSTPPSLKWQGKARKTYLVIGSNGDNKWRVLSVTTMLLNQGFTEWEVKVPVPTNRFWKVIVL